MIATRRSPTLPPAAFRLLAAVPLFAWLWTGLAQGGEIGTNPDSLYHRALSHLGLNTAESRQRALRELEQATRFAQGRTDILSAVARIYSSMGHHGRARRCLDQIARAIPDDAGAQHVLGQFWKWEWLASIEVSSYRKALQSFLRSCRLDSTDLESRVAVTALALARHNVELGMLGARSAIACDPDAAETALALGCASYRAGDLARADSSFRAAATRLPAVLRRRFTDLGGVAFDAPAAPLEPEEADRAAEAFWAGSDPDLTTPENEARLDFLARVAHAVLLFRDRREVRWDMRAELFARYGIPGSVELPPPPGADQEMSSYLAYIPQFALYPHPYPYHKQTWIYPELGLRVDLWDQTLRQSYKLAVSAYHDTDRQPSPAALAARPDLVAFDGGRGVYRALPPGVTPMPARGSVAHFPSDSGARLVAHLETAGGPADSLWGSWTVATASGEALARGAGSLSVSACDPGARRIVQFDADVPPGSYRIHLTVDDRRGRRGIVRLDRRVESSPQGLVMSELLMVCRASPTIPGGPVWIEPNLERRIGDTRTLTVYFEVDHLSLDPGGRSRFSYRYTLRRVDRMARPGRGAAQVFEASREEENLGAHRRQFVSVPILSLADGRYELEIEVRDLGSGAVASRSVQLVKE